MGLKGGLALIVALTFPALALATTQTYTINAGLSLLSVSGDLAGETATAQSTGSLTTSFSGTIKLDRTGNLIQFLAGSSISAASSHNEEPLSDGTPGSEPANYGRTSDGILATTVEALRGFVLDLQSPQLTLSANAFPSNQFSLDTVAGQSAYAWGTQFGTVDLSGLVLSNLSGTQSTLITSGSTETLTLHVQSNSLSYGVINTSDSDIKFTGDIVATRSVPEAGTLLLLLPAAGLLLKRRRSRAC